MTSEKLSQSMGVGENVNRKDQLRALVRVAKYKPIYFAAIVIGGVFAAFLEGVGLSFILPIVEVVQSPGDPTQQAEGLLVAFIQAYEFLGVPFTLGTVIFGVSIVLTVRWTSTFLVRWLRHALAVDYTRELQTRSFENALDANIEYFDRQGSDDILNAIVTQARYAGRGINHVIFFLEQSLLSLMYLAVAFVLAPRLTLFAVVFLGGWTYIFREFIEPGYEIGDKVAIANERVHEAVQAGTQGIRDTKLFGLKDEIFGDFLDSVNQYATASISLRRNEQAIKNFYNLLTAISVFVLIFLAIEFADMSLGALGIFLFAMFRLGPKASSLNTILYRIENNLPHLVRTHAFIDELSDNREPTEAMVKVPDDINPIEFDEVWFSYDDTEADAIKGISFRFEQGEFIGFVGQSGAGKSTIVSLLVRMYEPDSGEIRANGIPINGLDIEEWRSRIAVVRQNPFIFNDTLEYNLTIGDRGVSREELDRICRIAKVDEFLDALPEGYETQLGDAGVRLSGGQRQRVALARALLKDAGILVLDEATSDLDSNLEQQVQQSIENMDHDYAIVGIAHRLSTVQNADRIYTLERGEITEEGGHEELLAKAGKYAELYAIQSE